MMDKFDELVNDYTLVGDDGAVIFSSFDQFLEFVEEIRADEREDCAKVCENMERNGAWITKEEAAAAIRARGEK
jgi:hypothetical protein